MGFRIVCTARSIVSILHKNLRNSEEFDNHIELKKALSNWFERKMASPTLQTYNTDLKKQKKHVILNYNLNN